MMRKKWMVLCLCLLLSVLLWGCKCNHDWIAADCTTAKTCVNCKESIGEPLGHSWQEATCLSPRKCSVCGREDGDPQGHLWIMAVDRSGVSSRQCDRCGEYQTAAGNWIPLTECEQVNRSNKESHLNDVVVGNWDSRSGKLFDSIRFCVANQTDYKNTHYCIYSLRKNYSTLSGLVSYSEKSEKFATMQIQIYLDNELAYESDVISATSGDAAFTLDVREVENVRIVCFTKDTERAYCVVSASVC